MNKVELAVLGLAMLLVGGGGPWRGDASAGPKLTGRLLRRAEYQHWADQPVGVVGSGEGVPTTLRAEQGPVQRVVTTQGSG
jgi:hypothetical protein